jgi:hypothetical protein
MVSSSANLIKLLKTNKMVEAAGVELAQVLKGGRGLDSFMRGRARSVSVWEAP